ncbi:hypothetical protein HDV00_003005 [Rhizophlyctis rosea]|nr:hypothetical protein HDV00_003005 [Rhizophlyctis rosea]
MFSDTYEGRAQRTTIIAAHKQLYSSGIFKRRRRKFALRSGSDLLDHIEQDGGKPTLIDLSQFPKSDQAKAHIKKYSERRGPDYTYTLLPDGVIHFSRAGTPLREIMSKHAVHARAAPEVVYAGTFRLEDHGDGNYATEEERKKQRVLVVDNDSGTYGPRTDRGELQRLQRLIEYNFPGIRVDCREFDYKALEESTKDLDDGQGGEGEKKEGHHHHRNAHESGEHKREHAPGLKMLDGLSPVGAHPDLVRDLGPSRESERGGGGGSDETLELLERR